MVAGRIAHYGPAELATNAPHGIEHELRRLNYDIAGTAFAPAIAALRNLVPVSQILLGSDYPYVPISDTVDGMRSLGFSPEELHAIGRDNALRLLRRFAAPDRQQKARKYLLCWQESEEPSCVLSTMGVNHPKSGVPA